MATLEPTMVSTLLEWYDQKSLIPNPDFQRRSVWPLQAKSFFVDSVIRGRPTPNIYIRSIVNLKTRKAKREAVDGQQRLTTAIILLQVILEYLEEGKKLNYTTAIDIQRKFIFDSKDDGISRSYIFGYEKDNPSYEFLKTHIFCEHSSSSHAQETVYTHNLEHAKDFFSKCVSNLTHDDLEILYKKVTQQLLFNIFTISEEIDVCVAFETMNNRGKKLSNLEL